MNENIKWFAAAVAVVGLAIGGILYLSRKDQPVPVDKPVAPAAATSAVVPEEPAVKHPLPEATADEALPSLADSSPALQGVLEGLVGKDAVERFIVSDELVRHFVVSIDNLPTQKVAERLRPVKPLPGKFAVTGSEDEPELDPANFERYKPLVQMIQSADTQQLVATYTRYYPLFQEAYENLGHPPQYFNDRLIEVIDHLLNTPEIRGPIALAQPNVQFEYADPKLESLTAGQKALIRMGNENALSIKTKLQELRAALVAQQTAASNP